MRLLLYVFVFFSQSVFSSEYLIDCREKFNPEVCVEKVRQELERGDISISKDELELIYNQIVLLTDSNLEYEGENLEDVISVIFYLDELINRGEHLYGAAQSSEIIKDKNGKYDISSINERLKLYMNIVDNYPYSRYAPLAAISVNYFAILSCEVDKSTCEQNLEIAQDYLNKLDPENDDSIIEKPYSGWLWYNDFLLRSFLTNLYVGQFDRNDEILEKLGSYNFVADEFGVVFSNDGLVPAGYVDQTFVGSIVPGREGRLGSFFSNRIILEKLIEINEIINDGDTSQAINIYYDKMASLENDDYMIVLDSLESKVKADNKMIAIKEYLNVKVGNSHDESKFISELIGKLKVVPPKGGKYWGVGFGPVTKSDTLQFSSIFSDDEFLQRYFFDREKVLNF